MCYAYLEDKMERVYKETPLMLLKKYWGYDKFRPLQEEIINSVLSGKDTMALLPTGGGKSLTFQIPALLLEGITLVISPLVALMKDQIDDLYQHGIHAKTIYSGMKRSEIVNVMDAFHYSNYKLLYVSPERLRNPFFLKRLSRLNVSLFVVDEAHCISQWGYDFRPDYLEIASIRKQFPETAVLALTATATPAVVKDIQRLLAFKEGHQFFQKNFHRKGLTYVVRYTQDKIRTLYRILTTIEGSVLVYVRTRRQAEKFAATLQATGFSAEYYHADLSPDTKEQKQNAWQKGAVRIMVCTTAFGMGINKKDVRLVVHPFPPLTPEGYYQEAGRAGRDEQLAHAVLLYSPYEDPENMRKILERQYPSRETIREIYDHLGNYLEVAVGTGMEEQYEFDIYRFCKTFGYDERTLRPALALLYLARYVELNENEFRPTYIKILVSRNELYTLFSDADKVKDDLVEALLRSYSGLFTEYVKIDERKLAQQLNLSSLYLYKLFSDLGREKVIDYKPGKLITQIRYIRDREPMDKVEIPPSIFEDKKKSDKVRLEKMIEYAENQNGCTPSILLHYFGQKKIIPCGYCEFCRKQKYRRVLSYRLLDEVEEFMEQTPKPTREALCNKFRDIPKGILQEALDYLQTTHH